jgi:hypothetical protein
LNQAAGRHGAHPRFGHRIGGYAESVKIQPVKIFQPGYHSGTVMTCRRHHFHRHDKIVKFKYHYESSFEGRNVRIEGLARSAEPKKGAAPNAEPLDI